MIPITVDDIIRILLAVVAGGVIGLEREFRDKAAGFRTLIFICLGAAMFTLFSVKLAGDKDPTRIAANIVSGVGFLGAGVILREGGKVIGLTTASTIWLTAALGMGIGGGALPLTFLAIVLILTTLWIFPRFEHWVDSRQDACHYRAMIDFNIEKATELDAVARKCGLAIHNFKLVKLGKEMICSWQTNGSQEAHRIFRDTLLKDPEVKEFQY